MKNPVAQIKENFKKSDEANKEYLQSLNPEVTKVEAELDLVDSQLKTPGEETQEMDAAEKIVNDMIKAEKEATNNLIKTSEQMVADGVEPRKVPALVTSEPFWMTVTFVFPVIVMFIVYKIMIHLEFSKNIAKRWAGLSVIPAVHVPIFIYFFYSKYILFTLPQKEAQKAKKEQ